MDVLSSQNQFEMMTNTPEMQEFGLTTEMNELAFQQAAVYQGFESLDLLGLLDVEGEEAERVFSTINEVNLSFETLTVEGLENAVYAQRAAFAAERAAEALRQQQDAEENDEEDRDILAWAA